MHWRTLNHEQRVHLLSYICVYVIYGFVKYLLSLFLFLFILPSLSAQNLVVNWQQCLGGPGEDVGINIIPVPNGYMLLCGAGVAGGQVPPNHGNGDFWLVMTDTLGAMIWSRTYGGSDLESEKKIIKYADGGFVLFGETYSNDGDVMGHYGDADYWILKVESTGSLLWSKCFGGSYADWPNDMILATDSGFLLTGGSMSVDGNVSGNHGFFDCWMVKLDKDGNLQWEKSLGGSGADVGASVKATNDGGYIVGATTDIADGEVQCNIHGFVDAWIIKIDPAGNIEWQQCFGGTNGEGPNEILQTSDGGYIFAGTTDSNDGDVSGNHGQYDIWVVKLDSLGSLQWQRCYGGSKDEIARFIREGANGSYIVGGYSYSHDGDVTGNHSYPNTCDAWLFRISPTGDILWQQCIGGDEDDTFFDIVEFPNGKITLLGGSNTWDHSGDVQCEMQHNLFGDVWLVGLTDTTVVGGEEISEDPIRVSIYPNPAGDFINFHLSGLSDWSNSKITLNTMYGQVAHEFTLSAGQTEASFSTADIPMGIYFYILTNQTFTETGKVIIVR
jgi:hypothetical protein